MKRKAGTRAAFVVTIASSALAAGCSSEPRGSDASVIRDAGMGHDAPDAASGPAVCPASVPAPGSPCDPRLVNPCQYSGAPCPPFGDTPILAVCHPGGWQITQASCNPPPPEPPPDASGDVADVADANSDTADAADANGDIADAADASGDIADAADASSDTADARDASGDVDVVDALSPEACPTTPAIRGSACSRADPTPCWYTVTCPGSLPVGTLRVCVGGIWEERSGGMCNPPMDGGPLQDVPGG